jgi:catechol 2,3-dioxygenase-like lactoylglutathione lyase family enzyme
MSAADTQSQTTTSQPTPGRVDLKLEVIPLPVADVDRAKEFYTRAGWRLDADTSPSDDLRTVQMTPPGSPCSVIFGKNITSTAPGSAQGMHLIVADIEAALKGLAEHGIATSSAYHCRSGFACRWGDAGGTFRGAGADGRCDGPAPDRTSYGSFASFQDPDGNTWILQEVTTRRPGRIDTGITAFTSASDLAEAMRRASAAHGRHEERIGKADPDWPDWYAEYMAREQAGDELPT